jgi:capsular polysaccharide transport system permease protein
MSYHTINIIENIRKTARAILAIISREVRSRYTGDVFGYAWAYVGPLAWIGVVYVIFKILGRNSPIDVDIGSFILSGIVPYLTFRYIINAVLRSRTSYRQIVLLPFVTPGLVYSSVSILEFYNAIFIYALLLTGNAWISGEIYLDDPLLAIFGFFLSCSVGAAFGYAVAGLSSKSEFAVRITPIILRPMFYLSAVFYTANELPPAITHWIAWNPLMHAVEITRSGLFIAYESRIATAWVPIVFILAALFIGYFTGKGKISFSAADEPMI